MRRSRVPVYSYAAWERAEVRFWVPVQWNFRNRSVPMQTILVIDDDASLRDTLGLMLEKRDSVRFWWRMELRDWSRPKRPSRT